jgi:hypothetical protein
MNLPQASDIRYLFDELWPQIHLSAVHRERCLANLARIQEVFRDHPDNADRVLQSLDEIEDIGLVIASGIIFSANRRRFVPFDQYTMGHALELRIIQSDVISGGGYARSSALVVDHIAVNGIHDIEQFVRDASQTQFPTEPK